MHPEVITSGARSAERSSFVTNGQNWVWAARHDTATWRFWRAYISATIGVGTFLKVGGGGRLPWATPQTFKAETSPTPKISFLFRFRPLYFRKNAKDVFLIGKNRKKLQTFRGTSPVPHSCLRLSKFRKNRVFYSKQSAISVANNTKSQFDHQISDSSLTRSIRVGR